MIVSILVSLVFIGLEGGDLVVELGNRRTMLNACRSFDGSLAVAIPRYAYRFSIGLSQCFVKKIHRLIRSKISLFGKINCRTTAFGLNAFLLNARCFMSRAPVCFLLD